MTQSYRIYRPLLSVAVVLMLVCMSLTVIFATTTSEAAFAELEEGDKWALQEETNFAFSFSSTNGWFDLGSDDGGFIRNASIDSVSLNANLGVYVLFEVVEANATNYVIKVTAAENLVLTAAGGLTTQVPVEGQYFEVYDPYDDEYYGLNLTGASFEERTMAASADLTAASLQTVLFTVEKSSMNVTSIEFDSVTKIRGHIEALGIPELQGLIIGWELPSGDTMHNITYTDYIVDLALDLNLSGDLTFEPGISFVSDSLAENDYIESEFYVNGTLNWEGLADITGLPEWVTDILFGEDLELDKYGITGFPIDLAKIYVPGVDYVGNGTMNLTAMNIDDGEYAFVNYANKTIDDPVFGTIQVKEFEIFGDGVARYLYYPEEGKIVGAEIRYPLGHGFAISVKLASAPAGEVEDAITGISDYVTDYVRPGTISGIIKDSAGNPIAGATVRLNSTVSTTTDANGNFVFADVIPGTFTLNVSKDGYQSFEQGVTLIAGEEQNVGTLSLGASESTDKGDGEFPVAWVLVAVLAVAIVALLGFFFLQKKKTS